MTPPSCQFRAIAAGCALAFSAGAGPALAGPPYATDDSAPTDLGGWEIYSFVGGQHAHGETSGAVGFDLNYGAAPGLQLTATLPLEFTDAAGGDIGAGDVELGAKYRFLRQDGPLGLDVAIFPRVILPTAAARTQGDRKASFLLPLWAQRDAGPWSVFGGGGYMINRGPGARDFWTGGLAVTRQLNDRLTVGAEVYGREAEAAGGRSFVGANLGATYQLVEHWSLIGALGPGLQHAREEGRYTFYAALQAVF